METPTVASLQDMIELLDLKPQKDTCPSDGVTGSRGCKRGRGRGRGRGRKGRAAKTRTAQDEEEDERDMDEGTADNEVAQEERVGKLK